MNWKIYFSKLCTFALNIATFLAVIGEGEMPMKKYIFLQTVQNGFYRCRYR